MGKELEIVTNGEFKDQGYCVKNYIVRLFGELRQKEIESYEWNDRNSFETSEEWESYRNERREKKRQFRMAVREALDLNDSESFVIEPVVSEIFAVVAMYKIKK